MDSAFNLACGFAQNTGQLIAFRFLSGLGGSAPFAIAGAVIGDIWAAEERGFANGLFTVGAVAGTAVGPLTGAWIAVRTSWRWVVSPIVHWSTSNR
jgi:MFS family permease